MATKDAVSANGHSGDARLVRFLLQNGILSGDAGRAAQATLAALKSSESVLDRLARGGHIDEEETARALADRLRLPYVNLAAYPLDASVTALVREELAARYHVIPLRTHDGVLVIAVANPLDREGVHAIEFATGRTLQLEVATLTGVRDAVEHAYHLDDALNAYLDGIPEEGEPPVAELAEEATDIKKLLRESKLPPVVKLLNLILVDGVRAGASDIHIETALSELRVRYRIDGLLQESFRLPKWVQDPLIARCKVLAKLDITEHRVPQDGRIRIRYRESMIDLRVSSLPTQFGEKVTMRILDSTAGPRTLDQLNLRPRDVECLRVAMSRPQGMILVTGPTGSGKTTTLYAMITELISPTRNIVTIENPIEYQIRGVNQVEINEKQGLTFAGTLRSILRQDPDIILVGEIRDRETAEIAIRAAQTGHLVLSTLHTNDCVATIHRLLDLGIDPYLISSSIHAVVSQRLVRRICEHCAEPAEPDRNKLEALHIKGAHQFRSGPGCGVCRKVGYLGREAVFEVMPISHAMAKLIEARAQEAALRQQALADGMIALVDNAVAKILAGVTTVDEVLRVVDITEHTPRCPTCAHVLEEGFVICPGCGTPIHTKCQSCGMRLQKEWNTCPYCGGKAALIAAAAPALAAAPAFAGAPAGATTASALPGAAATAEAEAMRRYRALVVDDERDFRYLMEVFLKHSGMPIDIETASNGKEAVDIAQTNPPDIILLDIMMPEMDGFEVCKQLRANLRTAFIPILMLTALDDAANRTRGFLAGTDDYIGKPFDRADLLARVSRVMHRTYGLTGNPQVATPVGARALRASADAPTLPH